MGTDVALGLRALLGRPHLTPAEVVSIGFLLHGLEILPLSDPSLHFEVAVCPVEGRDGYILSFGLNEGELEFGVVESFDEPQGTETVCHFVARFDVSGDRKFGSQLSVGHWLREWRTALESKTSAVQIWDESQLSEIDWSLKPRATDFLPDGDELV